MTQTIDEKDPLGLPANAPGAKLDAGKQRPALVLGGFSRALACVVEVGTYGAQKYSPGGWQSVPNAKERYEDAMMRHWFEYKNGSKCDPETGINNLGHMAWNILAMLHFELTDRDEARSI